MSQSRAGRHAEVALDTLRIMLTNLCGQWLTYGGLATTGRAVSLLGHHRGGRQPPLCSPSVLQSFQPRTPTTPAIRSGGQYGPTRRVLWHGRHLETCRGADAATALRPPTCLYVPSAPAGEPLDVFGLPGARTTKKGHHPPHLRCWRREAGAGERRRRAMWMSTHGPHEARCHQLHTFAEELMQTYPIGLVLLWDVGDTHGPHVLLWQSPQGGWQVQQGDEEAIASWLHTLGTQLRAARRTPGRRHMGDRTAEKRPKTP